MNRTAVCALLLLALASGCGDADPAGPALPVAPDAGTAYLPADTIVTLAPDQWRDFRVVGPAGSPLKVRWQRSGAPEAPGERFRYFARRLGTETLTARIEDPAGRTWSRTWTVAVVPAGRPRVTFLPPGPELTAYATVATVLSASTPWPVTAADWRIDGLPAGADTLLRFVPDAPGRHGITVTIAAADTAFTGAWTVDVRPFAAARPAPVTGLAAAPGDGPGRAVLAWDPAEDSPLPLVAYEVRYRFDGPPTEATWATDPDPGDYAWAAGPGRPTVTYTPENAALEPGRETWFAVRARNERGQLSPLDRAVALRVPGQWWLEGTVRGPAGEPLAGVTVADPDRIRTTLTGPDGTYRVGPFFELTPVVLEAGTPAAAPAGAAWHFARSGTLTVDGPRRQDFLLIPRLGSAAGCFVFGSDFLAYLRTMTDTRAASTQRPNLRLYRWDAFPVTVHVPAWTSPRGVDFGACVREAVAIWNAALGEPFLQLTDDEAAAHVGFRYDLVGAINYGQLELDRPGGGGLVFGNAVPERASVRLWPDLPDAVRCTEIALHELGHVLGLKEHAYCPQVPYLMQVSAVGALDRGPAQAIHPDELRAVHLIRLLPNGLDMAAYPLDLP